jgi:hypothetical protein
MRDFGRGGVVLQALPRPLSKKWSAVFRENPRKSSIVARFPRRIGIHFASEGFTMCP